MPFAFLFLFREHWNFLKVGQFQQAITKNQGNHHRSQTRKLNGQKNQTKIYFTYQCKIEGSFKEHKDFLVLKSLPVSYFKALSGCISYWSNIICFNKTIGI